MAVGSRQSAVGSKSQITNYKSQSASQKPKREEIAAIVDKFLSQKLSEPPASAGGLASTDEIANAESPVKTIIHELRPQSSANGAKPTAVDFVSETDVRNAIEKGEKIYITKKTILTPSARDLGEEKEIFARI